MTRNKDLKRLVRTRMKKTGESYTSARAQITRKSKTKTRRVTTRPPTPVAAENPKDYATLAGMSNAVIKAKTGCNWERWVKTLDKFGAQSKSHGEIAEMVNKTWKIDGWWSQTVTVGYERIKGLRERGQRRDGSYEASKSRTFNVPVTKLYDAWANATTRKRWLDAKDVKIRTATKPKSMRIGWSDGTIIAVGFYPKGKDKSSVAVQHTKLPDRESSDRLKQYWAERFDALSDVLAEP